MKSQKIALIDYGAGNLGSVRNAFAYLGVDITLESSPQNLREYDKVILPGVGAFGDVMELVKKSGFDSAIVDFARSGKYLLGICLGMQLLFEKSYEFGEHSGLGLIGGEIVRFGQHLRAPHIGWNQNFFSCKDCNDLGESSLGEMDLEKDLESDLKKDLDFDRALLHPLLANIPNGAYLYFVHSYYASNVKSSEVLMWCKYGVASQMRGKIAPKSSVATNEGKKNAVCFPSIVAKENVLGIQPHPEKSHKIGLQILRNFLML